MKFWIPLVLLACRSDEKAESEEMNVVQDLDGDGFSADEDCNDNDATTMPGATEICDGIDNNCDGDIDEGVTSTFYADSDDDGFGNEEITIEACEAQSGFVENGTDCDDTSSMSFPGAAEQCDDLDNDCDGEIDEELDMDFFMDADGDGFGDDNNIVSGCSPDMGLSTIGGDCDDGDESISPIANEICDEIDNNCNEEIDEGVTTTYYADSDEDGYGDANSTIQACSVPEGYVSNDEDCNDVDTEQAPGADEYCDTIDNDCDGDIDESGALDGAVWYADADTDGFGDPSSILVSCTQPAGYVEDNTDCDDTNSIFNPSATETCNGFDDNCDGDIDEEGASNAPNWYLDSDNDGYGDDQNAIAACTQPTGYLSDNTDCDDNDDDINPGQSERCNGEDDNCDGNIDDDSAIDLTTWYADSDDDGYGDADATQDACEVPDGYVADNTDCDDTTSTTSPIADERCDDADNDCDGDIDEAGAIDPSVWYEDADEDGYGNAYSLEIGCDAPTGYIADNTDCDDTLNSINPGVTETCNDLDDNCDGNIDEDGATGGDTFYEDADGDGYGDANSTLESCDQPSGYIDNSDDCDDTNDLANLLSDEICDGIDNNCDGQIDEGVELYGTDPLCFADSCQDILNTNVSAQDGVYYISDDNGDALEAFCEMDFNGGGWLAVFNYPNPGASTSDAADFHSRLINNDDMTEAVLNDSNSASVYTNNIDLSEYTEVVYGWAASTEDDVSHYGLHTDSSLAGKCYLDGYCGAGVSMGTFSIYPTGTTQGIFTGNSPTYPHVGMGFSGQIILWGYDLNASGYSHWGNWYDLNACCNAGNTSDISQNTNWRYTIYIR
ncbi:MAG: MopE-related protein [Myxococcota bacterium]|nr:MopE-related protein [Myxococcota bacterium]